MRNYPNYPQSAYQYLCDLLADIEAGLIADSGKTNGAIQSAIKLGETKAVVSYYESGEVCLTDAVNELHDYVSENLQWLPEDKYKKYLAWK